MASDPALDEESSAGARPGGPGRVILADETSAKIGSVLIEPALRRISHDDGREAILEPRAMQVLVALLRAPGEVVSPQRLFETCWKGNVVGDDAINRAVSRLRASATDIADGVFRIETVARVGHRLVVDPAAGLSLRAGGPRKSGRSRSGFGALPRWTALAVAAAVLLLLAAAAAWRFVPGIRPAAPADLSIAVLPLRNLSPDDAYFVDGLTEQVRSDLAHRSDLRVAGVASSSQFTPESRDLSEIGRRLGVAYVLEGSARRSGRELQVEIGLSETSSGRRLWSETMSGSLDDAFAFQERIGARVASALSVRLTRAEPLAHMTTSGEVYSLYLTARGLIRTRQFPNTRIAIELLEQAVAMDPDFAPAWSSLGAAERLALSDDSASAGDEGRARAVGHVRRALALAPDLAEAHGALGMILGFETAEGARHIQRAVRLDPDSAELQYWYGHVRGNQGDFGGQVASYRRAAQLDPLWLRPVLEFVATATALGLRDQAAAEAQRFERVADAWNAETVRGFLAFAGGDFSTAVTRFRAAARLGGAGRSSTNLYMAETLVRLGLVEQAMRLAGAPQEVRGPWLGEIPALNEIRDHNARMLGNGTSYGFAFVATKRLINAGRGSAILEAYDSPEGLLGISRGQPVSSRSLVEGAALAALVLRQAGQEAEANRLLASANREISRALRRGRVPNAYLYSVAQVWALEGRHDQALTALERAAEAGWTYEGWLALPDISDEPAFRSLRGQPRFQRLRRALIDQRDRERRELGPIDL